MSIASNIQQIRKGLPDNVRLVAVSKTKPIEDILEAYHAGQRIFGENKVQELIKKQEILPHDIEWHLIGHLQTNKVKYIASFVQMIHAVDSLKLLSTINLEAEKRQRIILCLLHFYIASEETKFGLSLHEAHSLLSSEEFKRMRNIKIAGVMGMASFTSDEEQIHKEFSNLRNYFLQLKNEFFFNDPSFKEISMGMSDDYLIAIAEGSTIVRIGSTIFGKRLQSNQ